MERTVNDPDYTQLCVWQGTIVEDHEIEEAIQLISEHTNGSRLKYEGQIKTLPDKKNGMEIPNTGGRNDFFFYVHKDDVGKFAVPRLRFEIKWWEDILLNGGANIYPNDFLDSHKYGW